MTGSRARFLSVTLLFIAACAQRSGPGGSKLGQTQEAEGSGIAPIPCPTGEYADQCSWSADPTMQAVSAEFIAVGPDTLNSNLSTQVVNETAQTFQVKTASALPGSVGVTLRLLTNTNADEPESANVLIVDSIGPLNDPTTGAAERVPQAGAVNSPDSYDTENFQPLLAEGRYDLNNLSYNVDTQAQINFQFNNSTPNIYMQPGKTYAFVFYVTSPSVDKIGLAANADTQKWYCSVDPNTGTVDHAANGSCQAPSVPIGYGWTRQERMQAANEPSNPPWVQEALADLNFYATVNDGCTLGQVTTCGVGICERTVPLCDSFGNFTACYPGECTTDTDCVLSWVPNLSADTPQPGPTSGAHCINPSGQTLAGICQTLPESCNGYDDDCNGLTDDALGFTQCGTGACATSVYNCIVQPGSNGVSACAEDQGSNVYSCITSATACDPSHNNAGYGCATTCASYEAVPTAEVCNGIDDDCNGITDDGLTDTALCGSGPCARVAYSCTLQSGANGTEACDTGPADGQSDYYCLYEAGSNYGKAVGPSPDTFQCTADLTKAAVFDVCNDIDDDCDGYTDNQVAGTPPSAPGNTGKTSQYYYPTGTPGEPAVPTTTSPTPPNTFKGACRFGVEYCNSTTPGLASWDSATSPALPAVIPIAEVTAGAGLSGPYTDYLCNGQDDDCDGYTDNWPQNMNLPMTKDYYPNGTSGLGVGLCQYGLETCDDWFNPPGDAQGGTYVSYPGDPYGADARDPQNPQWAISISPVTPVNEICDGLDNNCNGQTDEGVTDANGNTTQICGTGVCASAVASCQNLTSWGLGFQVLENCTSGGFQNTGNQAANLGYEICNGLDDNCDGYTDNVPGQLPLANDNMTNTCHPLCSAYNSSFTNPANPGSLTICQYDNNGQNGRGICRPGETKCDGTIGWDSTCGSAGVNEIGPTVETCNNADDDCDGYTDNIALSGVNGGITETCDFACQGATDCVAGRGLCRDGVATCNAGSWGAGTAACVGEVGPTVETCNDADDDCDGYIDNNTTGVNTPLLESCDLLCTAWNAGGGAALGDANKCTDGVGICTAGTYFCTTGHWNTTSCAGNVGPTVELCNNLDDDCDGYIDNASGDKQNYSLKNTAYTTECGAAYGTPYCKDGQGICTAGTQSCEGPYVATPQTLASGQSNPYFIAVDSSGNVYWTDYSGGTVMKEAGGTVSTLASGQNGPYGITVDSSGNVYWTDFVGGTVMKEAGGTVSTLASGQNYPYGIAVDSSGNVYWTDYVGGTVMKEAGGTVSTLASGQNYPWGIAVDSSGNVYWTDETSDTVMKDAGGTVSTLASGQSSPNFIAVDSSGNVYWTDTGGGTVMKEAGGTVSTLASGQNGPIGIAVDSSGNVYWTDAGGGTVMKEAGGTVSTLASGQSDPFGITVDSSGNVYWTDEDGGTVMKLSTTSGWVTTTAEKGPTSESCNNADDDCDGYTDNAITGTPYATSPLKEPCDTLCAAWNAGGGTAQGDSDKCTAGVGICGWGTYTCVSPGVWNTTTCSSNTGPTIETCNNKDDDCDGLTDNAPGGAAYSLTEEVSPCSDNPSFPSGYPGCIWTLGTNTGQCTYNTDICNPGSWGLKAGGEGIGPSAEICNNKDDDCDGHTDNAGEGNTNPLETTIACISGCSDNQIEPTTTDCSPGTCKCNPSGGALVGACAGKGSVLTCTGGNWSNCPLVTGTPSDELCNNVDDDCDGYTDNWVTYTTGCTAGTSCMCPITDGSVSPVTFPSVCSTSGQIQIGVNTAGTIVDPNNSQTTPDTCSGAAGCKVYNDPTHGYGAGQPGPSYPGDVVGGCLPNYYDFDGNFCNGCEAFDYTAAQGNGAAESASCVTGLNISSALASGAGLNTIKGTIVNTSGFTNSSGVSENGHNYYVLTVNPNTWTTSAANNPCGSTEQGYGAGNTCTIVKDYFGTLNINITTTSPSTNTGKYVFKVYSTSCNSSGTTQWVNNGASDGNDNSSGTLAPVAAGSNTCSSGGYVQAFDLSDTLSTGASPWMTRNNATTAPDGWTPSGAGGVQTIYLDVFRIGGNATDISSYSSLTAGQGDYYTLNITH